jgi:hypothetical protein
MGGQENYYNIWENYFCAESPKFTVLRKNRSGGKASIGTRQTFYLENYKTYRQGMLHVDIGFLFLLVFILCNQLLLFLLTATVSAYAI